MRVGAGTVLSFLPVLPPVALMAPGTWYPGTRHPGIWYRDELSLNGHAVIVPILQMRRLRLRGHRKVSHIRQPVTKLLSQDSGPGFLWLPPSSFSTSHTALGIQTTWEFCPKADSDSARQGG